MFSRLVVLMFLAILRFVLGNNLYIKQAACGKLQSHSIHVWYIYLHLQKKINKMQVTIPYMDGMGM